MPHLAEAPDPFAGTAVGRYRLRQRIGAGPRAVVYQASPPSGNDPVLAFKLFSPEASADPEFSARCFDAAEAARRITHPCVVKVLEVGRHESRGYIIMEYVAAGSLEKLLENGRRLPFEQATRLLRDIALGLEAARSAGLFHLDLRPSNILLAADGRARIADFGQGWQPPLGKGLRPEDPIGGPVEYLSPDQVEGKLPEESTDLFALGLIYYRMLTGKLPYPGVDDREIAMKRVAGTPRPVRESFPGVDPRAIPVVEKLLSRRAENRFQTARGLLAVVERLVKGKTSTSHAKPAPPEPGVSVLPSEVRIRLTFTSAASHFGPGLALLAVAGTVAAGGEGFFSSIASIFQSTVSLAFSAAGLVALAIGCFLMRRELVRSGRARIVTGLLAGAALAVLVGTAALDRSAWSGKPGVLLAPVNFLLGAGGLAWFGISRCLEQDEETEGMRRPRVCLGLAMALWFLGWAGGNIAAPFAAMAGSVAVVAPLVISMAAALAAGFIAIVDPGVRPATRKIGLVLFGVGALGMAIWASAAAAGTLGSPRTWAGALLSSLGSLPAQIPRSGAPALLALGLVAAADYVLRGGLIRHYAKRQPVLEFPSSPSIQILEFPGQNSPA